MTGFGISGAEALDPTTRVFVCLLLWIFVCWISSQHVQLQNSIHFKWTKKMCHTFKIYYNMMCTHKQMAIFSC